MKKVANAGASVWILAAPLLLGLARASVAQPPAWPAELDLLATGREKDLYSSLRDEAERRSFFQRFWQARDPFPQTAANELREAWESRLAEAGRRWPGLADGRARVFLLRGEPASSFEARCPKSGSFEIWIYEPGFRVDRRLVFIFLLDAGGPARLWRPGVSPSPAAAVEGCSNQQRFRKEIGWLAAIGDDRYGALLAQSLSPPRPREWVSAFRSVPSGAGPGAAAVAADNADAAFSPRPLLRLLRPPEKILVGSVHVSALVEQEAAPAAERIERVSFTLDGKPVLTRNRPPFDVGLDLGPAPRLRKLRAEGLNGAGEVVARDELLLNAPAESFRVRLREPEAGRRYRRSLRIAAEVTPPPGAAVERVEIWFGEDRVATLRQPPYSLPFELPREGETGYVRAVAFLVGGGAAEDVAFVNTAVEPDEMDVRMVELFATVRDGQGRPVTEGLDPDAFVVLEDGVRQQIRQVERAGETPARVAALIDSSASMVEEMAAARQAALGFLRGFLRPQDQAAVIAFNRSPRVIVPLTGDLGELEKGAETLLAEDDTALYDSLAYSLLYLAAAQGQRAVLLLTDGEDQRSRITFGQLLETARRAGIAVYALGLGVSGGVRGEAARRLARLAEVTGGNYYPVKSASELSGVYALIEKELRTQYKISYQSSNTGTDDAFRAVRVQLSREGLEARTVSGYYP